MIGLLNLRVLISNYIPTEIVSQKKNEIFVILMGLLQKKGVEKDPIVDQLFYFLSSEGNFLMAHNWF